MSTNQDPSPEQIAAVCLLIQTGWTPAERLRRLRPDWRPTFLRCDGVRETIDVADYEAHHWNTGDVIVCDDTG